MKLCFSIHLAIVTKKNSLDIWFVKLRFPLIYENMLKSIATARSECTEKHKNKANFNTDYIFPGFMAMIEKKNQNPD